MVRTKEATNLEAINKELDAQLTGAKEECESLNEILIGSQQCLLLKNEHIKEKLK